jgi:NADH dehydrogenase
MNLPKTSQKRIVIIGGGFGGISLAKALKNIDAQVVLIDRHNYHTFQPLLYQVSTSGLEPDSIAYPIRKILKRLKNFHFRLAQVEEINADKKEVHTNIGFLSYDYLILATGTKTNFFGNSAMEKNAMPMKTVPQALNIRSLVLQNFERADDSENEDKRKALLSICIVGGGPTGVELAGAFAELKRHVFPKDYRYLDVNEMEIHLFEGGPRILSPMSEQASKKANEFLKNLDVQVHINTIVTDYDGLILQTTKGQQFKTKNLIWAAGVTGATVDGFEATKIVERINRYKVNRFNQLDGYDAVFAIGDIAYMETEMFPNGHPQVAQPAIQQGELLAKNLKLIFEGKIMIPFTYLDKGTLATVGRNRAVADLGKLKFGGFFAWFIWIFVHLIALVGFRNKVVVLFNWAYNYINYDKAARLIVRPFKQKI